VSKFTVRMFSGWEAATRLAPQNLARAHLSHFKQGSSPCQWTISATRYKIDTIKTMVPTLTIS